MVRHLVESWLFNLKSNRPRWNFENRLLGTLLLWIGRAHGQRFSRDVKWHVWLQFVIYKAACYKMADASTILKIFTLLKKRYGPVLDLKYKKEYINNFNAPIRKALFTGAYLIYDNVHIMQYNSYLPLIHKQKLFNLYFILMWICIFVTTISNIH